jgi:hypothetical protein
MAKFNTAGAKTAQPVSPFTTTGPALSYEGGANFTRDAKGELFSLAVTNMVGEGTFYETAADRDSRYAALVRQVTLEDPSWALRFVQWLRGKANMRSAAVVFAAEAVWARLHSTESMPFPTNSYLVHGKRVPVENMISHLDGQEANTKDFIPVALQRADEPGEFMAYWVSRYGKKLPQPVKRGLAIAIRNLFDEYAYAKYGRSEGWQLADLIEMVHPTPKVAWRGDLFRHSLNERHKRDEAIPASLVMLQARAEVMAVPQEERRALLGDPASQNRFRSAGMTWESLSGWLGGSLDASFWEAMIPNMGYMALLRNLRNFDQAGVSDAVAETVAKRLSDPEQVAKSRQFPYRFLSAYKAVQNDRWAHPLSKALDASVGNLPEFKGHTLILSDTSDSMNSHVSAKSDVTHVQIAGLFAVALARAGNEVDLYGFANGLFKHEIPKGSSTLRQIEAFTSRTGEVGHGTETIAALRSSYKGHDRVILISDMQPFVNHSYGYWEQPKANNTVTDSIPAGIPLIGINTAGYATTSPDVSKPNRYEISGFSDQVFRMVGLLDAGKSGDWPF